MSKITVISRIALNQEATPPIFRTLFKRAVRTASILSTALRHVSPVASRRASTARLPRSALALPVPRLVEKRVKLHPAASPPSQWQHSMDLRLSLVRRMGRCLVILSAPM